MHLPTVLQHPTDQQLHHPRMSAVKLPVLAASMVYLPTSAKPLKLLKSFSYSSRNWVEGRKRVIEIVKETCMANAEPWGKFELDETKIGRLDHKIEKLQIVGHVPGVEWLAPNAMSGDNGITLEEFAPFGVIGAILPVTHSVPTLTGNVISMVAAGNAIVFNPHPGGAKVLSWLLAHTTRPSKGSSASTTSSARSKNPPSKPSRRFAKMNTSPDGHYRWTCCR